MAPNSPATMMAANANRRARTDGSADTARVSSEVTARHRTLPEMRPLIVLPTYQEAENIDRVLEGVRSSVPAATVLVVDDSSPDGTAAMAEAQGQRLGQIEVMRRPSKSGLGSAYRDGFRWGLEHGFDVLIEMDSDLSHDPAALSALLAPVENGSADLVIGSRYVPGGSIPGWPWHRRLLSRWGNRYASAVLGMPVRDSTSGFRAYRAMTVAEIAPGSVRSEGYAFQIEMAYRVVRVNGRIVEVPIRFVDRTLGASKMSTWIVVEALLRVTQWAVRDRVVARREGWARR